jgi:hypothetical protein
MYFKLVKNVGLKLFSIMKKLLCSFLLLLAGLISVPLAYAETSNLGLIDGIWFSKRDYKVGDEIELHTAIFNHSDYTVTGVVEFYDNADLLGSRPFEIPNQNIKQLSLSTTADEGEHVFSAKISESRTVLENGETTELLPMVIDSKSLKIVEPAPDPIKIEEDDNLSNSETRSLLEDIIKTLEKYQGNSVVVSENSVIPETDNTEESVLDQDEIKEISYPDLVALSSGVKSLNEKFPAIEPVTMGINKFQNSTVGLFENLRTKNLQSLGKLNPESSGGEVDEALNQNPETETKKEVSKFEQIMRLVWGALLHFLVLIFSCLWCVVLLTLIVIYFITKYLFSLAAKSSK